MKRIFVIAEAGVNHNGSMRTAERLIDAAVKAGADAVKFQTFRAESLVSRSAPKASYQARLTDSAESHFDMIERLELGAGDHSRLIKYCGKRKVIFLSTPFDPESIDLLAGLGLEIFKIPSGEITNLPYLRKVGALKRRVILSTGMSNLREVRRAVDILVAAGTRKKDITVLHCNTEYPTPYKDANLRAMLTMGRELKVAVGYSDHAPGIELAIAAAALGASVIEKHFTLDRKMKGPDHCASLEPDELTAMVAGIRHVEEALGSGIKKPTASETKNIKVIRKSICASKDIEKEELFTEANITAKRPYIGMSPMEWDHVIGKPAKKDFLKDEIIRL